MAKPILPAPDSAGGMITAGGVSLEAPDRAVFALAVLESTPVPIDIFTMGQNPPVMWQAMRAKRSRKKVMQPHPERSAGRRWMDFKE